MVTETVARSRVRGVDVVHWNPVRNSLPHPLRRLPLGRRVRNFGDMLGPEIVAALVAESGEPQTHRREALHGAPRVVAVGSIVHLARDGDVVWGSGINAKNAPEEYAFESLDVRAVRGPLTRAWFEDRGIPAPAVYGDPGLLVPTLFPEFVAAAADKRHRLTVIPNLHDAPAVAAHPDFFGPRRPWRAVVERIARSEMVVGSSLHAIIVAEALDVPCALIGSTGEPMFKYQDYFSGTGREAPRAFAADIDAAIDRARASDPLTGWDPEPLLAAFPRDVWDGAITSRRG